MAGLNVGINVRDAALAMKGAFEEFGERAFPRAVQFNLNRVAIEATNRFRERLPIELKNANTFTRQAVRYELDKERLNNVSDIDDVRSAVFVLPLQSVWLKYALGEETRAPGDVGIEAWFPDQSQLYLPVESGLGEIGIRPNAQGNYKGSDIKRIGRAMAQGYRGSGGARFGGVFEIRTGDRDPARLGVGIHSRPMRGVAVQHREKVRAAGRRGEQAPRTRFAAARGRQVDVPRVVNLAAPQLLFLTRPDATYKPVLTLSWEQEMERAASKFGDWMEEELADKMEHAMRRGRR